jgi:hypothetical protein
MGTRRPNMRSSIYLGNDGKWHGWVTVGLKADGSADRRHRKGRTEAEVTLKVRELESQRESGYVSKPGRAPTLAEWMAEYLDVLCERLVLSEKMAPRTLADYRSKTRNWINPQLGKHRLDKLAPEHLDAAYAVMLRRGLSPSTVLKVHRILSRALRVAVRRGRISRNVATLVDAPSASRFEIEPLTREEARRILDVAATKRNGSRWSVALALAFARARPLVCAGHMWPWKPARYGPGSRFSASPGSTAAVIRTRVASDGIGDPARKAASSTGTFRPANRAAQSKDIPAISVRARPIALLMLTSARSASAAALSFGSARGRAS